MREAALRTPWRASPSGLDPVGYYASPLSHFYATPRSIPLRSSRLFSSSSSSSRVTGSRGLCRPYTYTSRGRASLPVSKCHYSSGPAAQGPGAGQSGGSGNKNALKYAIVGGVLGAGVLVYWDEVRHLYRATTRTGRVVSALAVCINE